MSHLESLIAEYLDWQGYVVKRNIRVGQLAQGGYEMELDVVGYRHSDNRLVHYEPSLDAQSWAKREERYEKKFAAGKKYILSEVFPWLSEKQPEIHQIAVFFIHPSDRDVICGGEIHSIDELMSEIREQVEKVGPMISKAIPENYPLLRTLQLSHCGYCKVR